MWQVFAVNRIKRENATSTNKDFHTLEIFIISSPTFIPEPSATICAITLIGAKIAKLDRSEGGYHCNRTLLNRIWQQKNWNEINGERRKLYRPLVKGKSKL